MKAFINTDNDALLKNLKSQNIELVKSLKDADIIAIYADFEKYQNIDYDINSFFNNESIEFLKEAIKLENKIILTDEKDFSLDFSDIDENKKQSLLINAFYKISLYDSMVLKKMSQDNKNNDYKAFIFNKLKSLKYGENPHQKASLYNCENKIDWSLLNSDNLSYNDILDISLALEITSQFYDVSCCTIVKHETPCAVALSKNIQNALEKALDSDPTSCMGSVICFSQKISANFSQSLAKLPIRTIVAPDFEKDAVENLENIKLIKINSSLKDILKLNYEEIKLTPLGALVQQKNTKDLDVSSFKVMTKNKPSQNTAEDMIFAMKVLKYIKSSAVVIAKDLRTIGICSSETNKERAVEIALSKVCDSAKDAVLAVDGTINSKEIIQIALQDRLSAIIQTANGKKDNEIAQYCDKMGLSMISTGIRHYKH